MADASPEENGDLFPDLIPEGMRDGKYTQIGAKKLAGYPAPPGSGPVGKTCRDCAHYISQRYHDKRHPKCLEARPWTHGPGTDIRAGAPACSRFSER